MNKIRELRTAAGISCSELGRITGIDPSLMSRYELGKTHVPAHALQRIAKALKCDVSELTLEPLEPIKAPAKKAARVRWYTVEEKAPTIPCLIANQNGLVLCTQRVIAVDDGRRVLYFNGLHGLRDEDIKPELAISLWMPIPEVPR